VEADPRGEVEVEIGVVDHVQAPQRRQVMEQHMLDVDEKIEEDHPDEDRGPVRDGVGIQKPPSFPAAQQGKAHGENGEEETDDEGIERHDPQVDRPPGRLGDRQGPPRRDPLQHGEDQKGPQEEAQADCCFVFHEAVTRCCVTFQQPPGRASAIKRERFRYRFTRSPLSRRYSFTWRMLKVR